jgi:hypothetical protein
MSAAELSSLLPDAPYGHALRLREVFSTAAAAATRPRLAIPRSPAILFQSSTIAAGVQSGDL